jgi:hypothetical protein
MAWLSNDFREERRWKMALAKKTAKYVVQLFKIEILH